MGLSPAAAQSSHNHTGSAGSSSGYFLLSCTDKLTITQVSRDLLDAIWSFLFASSGQRGPKKPKPQIKMGRDEVHQLLSPTGEGANQK